MSQRTAESRFTFVELMIVVAIVAILAAIAIPVFRTYQLRAKSSEVWVITDGIAQAQDAYFHENGSGFQMPDCGAPTCNPSGWPTKQPRPWETTWAPLGFAPDGAVRCAYGTGAPDITADPSLYVSAMNTCGKGYYSINFQCDLDGDISGPTTNRQSCYKFLHHPEAFVSEW